MGVGFEGAVPVGGSQEDADACFFAFGAGDFDCVLENIFGDNVLIENEIRTPEPGLKERYFQTISIYLS